jgi:hypothetical protein
VPTTQTDQSTQSLIAPNKIGINNQYKQSSARAINELVTKRGMSAKDAITAVQGAIDQRTNDVYNTQQQQYVNGLYNQMSTETNPNRQMMLASKLKQAGIDIIPAAKQFTVSADRQLTESGLNGRYDRTSANNIADNANKLTVAQGNNAATIAAAHVRATGSGNGRSGGNGQPKQLHIQGKSGQIYTPMQIAQAHNDAAAYYQAQGDGSMELATPADQNKWDKAAFIVNDQQ